MAFSVQMTMAVMTRQWDDVKRLVDEDYPLNEGDAQSALRLACRSHLPTVKLLVEHGANVNYEDPAETSTPLLSACFAGKLEIATFLVENGALVNHRDTLGNVPLVMQVVGPSPNPSLVKYLLQKGADPNVSDENGRPVIVLAKLRSLQKIVDLLLEYKAKDEEPVSEEWEEAKKRGSDRGKDYEDENYEENEEESTEFSVGFAMNQIGTTYLYYDGDYEAAIEFFEQAIEADPLYKNPYLHMITTYKKMGNEKEAEKYMKLFKEQFGIASDEIDYEKLLDEQERQRDVYMNSLPNVATIRIG